VLHNDVAIDFFHHFGMPGLGGEILEPHAGYFLLAAVQPVGPEADITDGDLGLADQFFEIRRDREQYGAAGEKNSTCLPLAWAASVRLTT